MIVLQTGGIQSQSDYLLLLAASLVAVGLSLFIVFHAYRGYRRNDSRRMLFFAAGLCLLTVIPMALSIGINSLGQIVSLQPRVYTFHLPIVIRASEIAGLGCILYSLLITPGRSR